jgi:type IV fimbrial biogenesis protein FimT
MFERLRRQWGVTLLELLVTMTVLAVLAVVAVPAFTSTIRRNNVANAANAISGDLQFARGQAASQHRFVSMCRSADGGASCATAGGVHDFDRGWLIYSYDVGASGPDQVYSPAIPSMTILKIGPPPRGASVQATDGAVITFSQAGAFVTSRNRNEFDFLVCYRDAGNGTGVGSSTTAIPGTRLALHASGAITPTRLAHGAACGF